MRRHNFLVLILELCMTATIVGGTTAFATLPELQLSAAASGRRALSASTVPTAPTANAPWRELRGGAKQRGQKTPDNKNPSATEPDDELIDLDLPAGGTNKLGAALLVPFASFGRIYSSSLEARPILTKSATAGFIFALSDFLAQRIERKSSETKLDWTRLICSGLVGLLYFGPAAHYWYEMIFWLLPGTSLGSTLAKAFWGQVIFGPSFTCIFFAVSLLQGGNFTLGSWWSKIRSDLPGAWLAGVGFWPLVDLISFSIVPIKWIPLFINLCSLVWTIYLSIVANKSTSKAS